jgi:putative hemolysin
VRFPELSYSNPGDPPLKRGVIRLLERLAGRDYFAPHYDTWRATGTPGQHAIRPLLGLIGVELEVVAPAWPARLAPAAPLVLVANHPYGILDGLAALSMAEDLGRPFRVLINRELMKVPELEQFALPIDFRETPDALRTNLRTRNEAIALLRSGTTIIVFPAGGVATAPSPFAPAVELPWKMFAARMIQAARADVLPVYFEGQCSPLFHLASRLSMTLRLSLLIREFRRSVGRRIVAHAGEVISFAQLQHKDDRRLLLAELYDRVHALGKSSPQPRPR